MYVYIYIYIYLDLLHQIQTYACDLLFDNVLCLPIRSNHLLSQLQAAMDSNICIDVTVSRDIPMAAICPNVIINRYLSTRFS